MDAVREFARKGGLVTTGDDAGYIYSMYGFGISRELELHEEAGFHPLEVIEHATWNGAKLLGMEDRLGKVREGFIADLLVVNGNPLENLKLLNPYGADVMLLNGQPASELLAAGARRQGPERARRRHRVDDQGRHPVSRADADARSEGHGRPRPRGTSAVDRRRTKIGTHLRRSAKLAWQPLSVPGDRRLRARDGGCNTVWPQPSSTSPRSSRRLRPRHESVLRRRCAARVVAGRRIR